MKTLSSIVLPCEALLGHVAAQGGYLFTIDRSITTPSTSMIDAEMASAIIARRRAMTADRYLGITDSSLLEDLNTYGGYQAPLFGEENPKSAPGKLFIRFSNVDMKIQDFDQALPDLWIDVPTRDLLNDFKAIPNNGRKEKDGLCEYVVPASLNAPNTKDVEVIFTYPTENGRCLAASAIPNIPVVLSLHSFLPTNAAEVPSKMNGLIRILKHFSATDNMESTVLILPSDKKLKKPKKKPTSNVHSHEIRSAQQSEEERLDLAIPTPNSEPTPFDTLHPLANTSSNHTLPHIIPVCFSTQSACQNTTNSCSGHGQCYKAHGGCYKCRCGSTTVPSCSVPRRRVRMAHLFSVLMGPLPLA